LYFSHFRASGVTDCKQSVHLRQYGRLSNLTPLIFALQQIPDFPEILPNKEFLLNEIPWFLSTFPAEKYKISELT
jgi:hypothetical protein